MMFPVLLRLKVKNSEGRGINLIIPLILLLILMLPLILIALPFFILWNMRTGKFSMEIIPALWEMFCASRGTEIVVNNDDSDVIFKIL